MTWNEENRLMGINDNGRIHQYTYDANGERVIKSSGDSQNVAVNGQTAATIVHTDDYTGYVSPYFVINKGKFTKHYFEGAGRIVSKLGNGTFAQPPGITAGGVNYTQLTAEQQKSLDNYVKSLGVPPGPPTQQGIYATPEFTGDPYPSETLKPVEENQEPPEGWPRNPVFNAPGDVPGPPVQFGPPVEPTTVKAGEGFTGIGLPENDIFYFHPDHLGSTSYISTKNGSISQHVEYIAFGEVLFEEHSSTFSSPYLFNGKELDRETNLSYYGARYLDIKTSLWLSVDPMMLEESFINDPASTNGGVYNSQNLASYSFSYNNPITYVDPDGECPNCVTAAAGALIGGLIGGGIEAGMQLYKSGKVTDWKAVGGSALQGAVVGGAAGFTGGASLAVTAGVAGSANAVGGSLNRSIQGKQTTATDLLIDFSIGAVIGAGAKYIKTPFGSGAIKGGAWIETTESMSVAAAKYQTSITGQAANKSFLLKGVKFDGFANGILQDAKSGMGNFVDKATGGFKPWFTGGKKMLEQAERQIGAANGTKIQWFFENKAVMEATQKLFKKEGIKGIELIYKPN